ncbi:MAG: hypothetical protein CVU05_04985 [Bacteroidetes bacterium HGW-Bacteroidetes-21]|nr:MAG: hypothetical protein CVU05_04985 [Bacteroidetes bacterium HGW-Bacteroidetes-21]
MFVQQNIIAQSNIDFNGWEFMAWKSSKTSVEDSLKAKKIEVKDDFDDPAYTKITRFTYNDMNTLLYFDSLNQLSKVQQIKDFSVIYLDEANAFFDRVKQNLLQEYGVPHVETHDTSAKIITMTWNLHYTNFQLIYDYKYKIIDEFGCCSYKVTINASPVETVDIHIDLPKEALLEHLIFRGMLAEIYVEKAMYEAPKYENFLMKFTIKNINEKTIGVDLSDYWRVIYPNQWGLYEKPVREDVNEQQIIPNEDFDKNFLKRKYKKKELRMIKPGESFSYYREWNGSGEKPVLKGTEKFVIITVDGQLFITNGKLLEQVKLLHAEEQDRAVVLPAPIVYKALNDSSMIIEKF